MKRSGIYGEPSSLDRQFASFGFGLPVTLESVLRGLVAVFVLKRLKLRR
ncbi:MULTISPECIES: hypothetical protein [Asticcacaulis]|nr:MULTISPECIES: hypothetical protein [Asticcacaulis]MBP2160558.1 hypothetical protein [Asticcacaulis solisilvae]MDR6801603.1 hypothetical protein [Asticcacaulis sp. BE141]